MIKYDKLFQLFESKGITTYTIRKQNIMSQGAYYHAKNGTGGLDNQTLNKLCRILKCQPADIMEYVPDDEEELAS